MEMKMIKTEKDYHYLSSIYEESNTNNTSEHEKSLVFKNLALVIPKSFRLLK